MKRGKCLHLGLPGGNDGVTGNQLGEDSTSGLNTEGKGADIDKNDISSAFSTREDTTLDSSTVGDSLVGVDSLGRLLATEVLFEELLDLGDTSGTTNKDNLYEYMRLVHARLVNQKIGNSPHRYPPS